MKLKLILIAIALATVNVVAEDMSDALQMAIRLRQMRQQQQTGYQYDNNYYYQLQQDTGYITPPGVGRPCSFDSQCSIGMSCVKFNPRSRGTCQ